MMALVLTLVLSGPAAAYPVAITGSLGTGGSEPYTVLLLTAQDGKKYEVRGPLEQELRSVGPGWIVEAVGRAAGQAGPLPSPFFVVQYRIVEVQTPQGPRKPVVGRVLKADDQVFLVDEALRTYKLEGQLPSTFLGLEDGTKAAVVGQVIGFGGSRRLKVEFYHVLSPK